MTTALPIPLALLLCASPGGEPAAASHLSLPDGPAAKTWAAVDPTTAPAVLPKIPLDWNQVDTWRHWGELLRKEAADEHPDPARRAALCLLARSQGRARDAWKHYIALGRARDDAAPWIAAVTPLLLPGIPLDAPVEAGGRPAPLPDGVLLSPFLPPSSGERIGDATQWRSATVHHLRVGAAVIDLTVTVEATGVQVDIAHVDGGAAHLEVQLPEPEGFEIRVEYLDWIRRDDADMRTPIPVDVRPGEEPHQLYGRILERRAALPTGAAQELPAGTRLAGLVIEVDPQDPHHGGLERIAAVLSEVLDVDVRLRSPRRAPETFSPTVFHLPAGPERGARLRYLTSAVEGYLLRRDGD